MTARWCPSGPGGRRWGWPPSGTRTYAPIRYLAEYFGYTVSWDNTTRTAMLQSAGSGSLESASVSWTRMNHSYRQKDDIFGDTFVNCYYDLASITDQTPL